MNGCVVMVGYVFVYFIDVVGGVGFVDLYNFFLGKIVIFVIIFFVIFV